MIPGNNLLPHNINIATKRTVNIQGGQQVNYVNAFTNVPAFVQDASASLRMLYMQRNIQVTHVVFMNGGPTCNTGDIVVFGARKFFITQPLNPLNDCRLLEWHVSEVTPGSIIIEE